MTAEDTRRAIDGALKVTNGLMPVRTLVDADQIDEAKAYLRGKHRCKAVEVAPRGDYKPI